MNDAAKIEKYSELAATVRYTLPVLNMLSKMFASASSEDADCTENMMAAYRILNLISNDLQKAYEKISD
ncbi:MAG: hypothetical protein HY881_11140 [Deltaproteobacteria bacterium]|nr:hypothetical protein [Deltaproteobacteria bacterium]